MHVGLGFQPLLAAAREHADRLASYLAARGHQTTVHSLWDESMAHLPDGVDLLVAFGGDGSILRACHLAAPTGVPIVGVNLGRVGFLSEIDPAHLPAAILPYIEGEVHLEERLLVEAAVKDGERPFVNLQRPLRASARFPLFALNEVFVGRGAIGRLVRLEVRVDGIEVGEFRADGLMVASPTGSTAYALAAGGPVIGPDVDVLALVTVAAQTAPVRSIIVPAHRVLEVTVHADHAPVLSSDGLLDVALESGDTVVVGRSAVRGLFLRARPADSFYAGLVERLR